jgi:hypothetical protein
MKSASSWHRARLRQPGVGPLGDVVADTSAPTLGKFHEKRRRQDAVFEDRPGNAKEINGDPSALGRTGRGEQQKHPIITLQEGIDLAADELVMLRGLKSLAASPSRAVRLTLAVPQAKFLQEFAIVSALLAIDCYDPCRLT